MFLSTSINVLFTHDPTSYVAFLPHTPSCLNKGFVVVVVVVCTCLSALAGLILLPETWF